MNFKNLKLGLVIMSFVALPFVAAAQQAAPNQGQPPAASSINKKDQANFKKAFPKVMNLVDERDAKLAKVKDPQKVQNIKKNYYDKMSSVIQNNNLTVQKFNAIASRQGGQ